jgi:hypothetical protein
MKVWIDSPEALDRALSIASKAYGENLVWRRSPDRDGKGYSCTLTVVDSRKQGARRGRSGRRIAAACWHAYRDFIRACFAEGATRVKSCRADWTSLDNFEDTYEATGDANMGSMFEPLCYADACECEDY